MDNVYLHSRRPKKGVILFGGVWLYDYEKNEWQKANGRGDGQVAAKCTNR